MTSDAAAPDRMIGAAAPSIATNIAASAHASAIGGGWIVRLTFGPLTGPLQSSRNGTPTRCR
jgi:hypothetical protein